MLSLLLRAGDARLPSTWVRSKPKNPWRVGPAQTPSPAPPKLPSPGQGAPTLLEPLRPGAASLWPPAGVRPGLSCSREGALHMPGRAARLSGWALASLAAAPLAPANSPRARLPGLLGTRKRSPLARGLWTLRWGEGRGPSQARHGSSTAGKARGLSAAAATRLST